MLVLQNDRLKCPKSVKASRREEGRRRGAAEEVGTADKVTEALETDPVCSQDSGPRRVKEELGGGLRHPVEAGVEVRDPVLQVTLTCTLCQLTCTS